MAGPAQPGDGGEEEAGEGGGPGGADGDLAVLAQQPGEGGEHEADEQEAARGAGPAGAGPEQVERARRARTDVEAGLAQEGGGPGQEGERPGREDEERGADGGEEAEPVRREVGAAHGEDAEAEEDGQRPDDRGERHRGGEQEGVRPGGTPAAPVGPVEAVGGDGGAGDQREQDREDGGAEPAGGEGAGGGGQEGVRDGGPGAQEPGFDDAAGREVGGEAGERDRADEEQGQRGGGGAEEQRGERGQDGEVGRGALGAAGAEGVPAVGVPRPEAGDGVGGGQQGAAGQRAAGEEVAAGHEGDEEQQAEEDRAGLAGDLLEPGELLDLQVVGVVAAGSGLDDAVAGAAGVGLAAAEVGGELLGGGADGGAGRREEGAEFARRDGRVLAALAGGQDLLGPQQGGEEAHDLVDGLAGDLADEVGEGAQQGADDEPQEHVRQGGAAAVGEQGVDGAGLVDAVRVGGGAAGAVDGAALAGGRLGVPQDGVGGDEDAVAGGVGAPAQVDVVAHEGQAAVEAAEFLEDVAADQHAGGGDGEDGADLVVLALVLLAAVESGPAAAAAGDGDTGLQELLPVVPAAQLGSDDGGVGVGVGDAEEFGEGAGLGGAVVVEQPEPLHRFAVREFGEVVRLVVPGPADGVPAAGALQVGQVLGSEYGRGAGGLLDGGAEAGAACEVEDAVGADGVGDELGRVVGAAGVGRHHVLHGAFLCEQPGEGVRQPAGAVVGDEHGGDDVSRKLRS